MLPACVLLTVTTLVACSLFGSPDPIHELREYLEQQVPDENRRSSMLAAVSEFEAGMREFETTSRAVGKEMITTNRDYDVSDQAISALFAKHNAARARARDAILEAILKLRDLATPIEWKDIMEQQISAYRERLVTTAITTK